MDAVSSCATAGAFVARHFDNRLQAQQATKGLLYRIFLASCELLSTNEDSATLGKLILLSDGIEEEVARLYIWTRSLERVS